MRSPSCASGCGGCRSSPLNRLYGGAYGGPLKPVTKQTVAIGPERAQGLEAVKQLVERALEDDIEVRLEHAQRPAGWHQGDDRRYSPRHAAPRRAGAGAAGVAGKDYRRLRDKMKKIGNTGDSAGIALVLVRPAQIRIAELCIEDGRTDRAKQILVECGWKRRPSSRTPCATQHT